MPEYTYTVYLENHPVARNMPIEFAMVFINSLTECYYNEPQLHITLEREVPIVAEDDPNTVQA